MFIGKYLYSYRTICKIVVGLLLLGNLSCQFKTTLKINEGLPPSFALSSSNKLKNFAVYEVTPISELDYTAGLKTECLWKIEPKTDDDSLVANIDIIYGEVPPGFKQIVPVTGSPVDPMKKKIYVAKAETSDKTAEAYFSVNDEAIMEVILPTKPKEELLKK